MAQPQTGYSKVKFRARALPCLGEWASSRSSPAQVPGTSRHLNARGILIKGRGPDGPIPSRFPIAKPPSTATDHRRVFSARKWISSTFPKSNLSAHLLPSKKRQGRFVPQPTTT